MSSQGHAQGIALDSRDAAFFEVLVHSFASPPGDHIVGMDSLGGVGWRGGRLSLSQGGGRPNWGVLRTQELWYI